MNAISSAATTAIPSAATGSSIDAAGPEAS